MEIYEPKRKDKQIRTGTAISRNAAVERINENAYLKVLTFHQGLPDMPDISPEDTMTDTATGKVVAKFRAAGRRSSAPCAGRRTWTDPGCWKQSLQPHSGGSSLGRGQPTRLATDSGLV